MSRECPYCKGTGKVAETPDEAAARALYLMQRDPTLDLYEGGDERGKGNGVFYLTKTPSSPRLTRQQIDRLFEAGYLERYPGERVAVYKLATRKV